jgi:NAD-reducing hydrogenase small subunit
MTEKRTLATVWLDGCSGCHMSLLDMDERLLQILTDDFDLVYSPLVDVKTFPRGVDVTLIEGAVSNEEDLHKLKLVREHTHVLVSLGDCAVTANVPSMRNSIPVHRILERVAAGKQPMQPGDVPLLCAQARPVHNFVHVDVFVPGCPPSADTIHHLLKELASGRKPNLSDLTRFGA